MFKTKARKSFAAFDITNYLIFLTICFICLLPFLHLLAKSLSDKNSVIRGDVTLWPINFQLGTYAYVLGNTQFSKSLLATVFVTVVGTFMSVFLTSITAYPLSKTYLKGRKLILYAFVFAWMCGPSIVPIYLLMKYLGLLNNLFSLILVDVIWCFNMLVMKSYFESIPEELCESGQIDGASNIRTLFSIILPVCKPVIATICVFSAFGYWNMYFYPYLFITRSNIKPLQLYIYDLIYTSINGDSLNNASDMGSKYLDIVPDIVRSTTVFISIVPIMLIYPFVQKYFVKGSMLGSVKG